MVKEFNILINDVPENRLTLLVNIDAENNIHETNETNNTTSVTFQRPYFLNIAKEKGIIDSVNSRFASFGDVDNDNDLDLYVVNMTSDHFIEI